MGVGCSPHTYHFVCLFVVVMASLSADNVATPDHDPHFPNTNQTKRCWVNYVKFHKCRIAKGADDEECRGFHQAFRSMCPNEWVEAWDEQRSNKIFPGLPRNLQGD